VIPLPTLLEDKTFRKYFETTPALYPTQVEPGVKPWRLWVKKTEDSKWTKKEVSGYQTAAGYVLDRLDDIYDAAVQSRARSYGPPHRRVRATSGGKPIPGPEGVRLVVWSLSRDLIHEYGRHDWCFQCRRPTIFGYFHNHHAFRGTALEGFTSADVRRCTLCGISHSFNRSAV
jgi:hypothetical protein